MIARQLYLVWLKYRLQRFLRDARRAREIQENLLLTKLARHFDSDFGRAHRFDSIRTVADFRSRVPIITYEDLMPYMSRVINGETNALFGPRTRVLMFAMTSGTTGEPKRLPITQDSFQEYKRGWHLWAAGAFGDHQDLLQKKTLQLSSDWKQFQSSRGIPCGQISGLAATTRPRIASSMFVPSPETIQIHDWAAKHYTTLRIALSTSQIGLIVTANPSTLLELAKRAYQNSEWLVRDIHDGTLSCDVPPHVKSALAPWISCRNRERALELERLADRDGGLVPKYAWPELSLLSVWTGGSASIYLPQLPDWYGAVPVRDHGLSASEGRMTIPLADGNSAGLLEFNHHFFEFVPLDEHGKPAATVLQAHELAEGEDYYVLLTTSGGLYRYDICDVVRCVGYIGEAPLLQFLNKGKHFCSLTGEKLSEYQVVSAVETARKELRMPVSVFLVAPVIEPRAGYVLLVERGQCLGRDMEFAAQVQTNLERLNEEYASKCISGRLVPLQVREVPVGTWRKMRDARVGGRGNLEEYKQIFLSRDPSLVPQLSTDEVVRPLESLPTASSVLPLATPNQSSFAANLSVSNSGLATSG